MKYEVICHHCNQLVLDDCVIIDRTIRRLDGTAWYRGSEPLRFHTKCFLGIAGNDYVPVLKVPDLKGVSYDEAIAMANTFKCPRCGSKIIHNSTNLSCGCLKCGIHVTDHLMRELTKEKNNGSNRIK